MEYEPLALKALMVKRLGRRPAHQYRGPPCRDADGTGDGAGGTLWAYTRVYSLYKVGVRAGWQTTKVVYSPGCNRTDMTAAAKVVPGDATGWPSVTVRVEPHP